MRPKKKSLAEVTEGESAGPIELPMFPLGNVLFPTMLLPLHVFEPRYRVLAKQVLEGDREFGVTLIERGSEVGGHDVRSLVGTVAQVVEHQEFDDGRWALGCVGTRRIRVVEWLDDNPYPRALVEHWPDVDPPDGTEDTLAELRDAAETALRDLYELYEKHGANVSADNLDLAADPLMASYQISALAPVGPLDHHKLLETSTAAMRLELVGIMLADEAEVVRMRLGE